jgi:hypothetical protein
VDTIMTLTEPQHIAIIAPGDRAEATSLRATVNGMSLPGAVVQTSVESEAAPANPSLDGKATIDGNPTAYVCVGPQCSLPVISTDALRDLLLEARKGQIGPPA